MSHIHSHTHATPPAPTQPTSLIFHRDEERAACIILTERQQRETSLRYLHSHMHCQRFIVQGFNGALTPPSPLLPRPRTRTNTPGIHHSALLLSLFSPLLSVFPLSAVHLPLLFISRPPPRIRFPPAALPGQTASITSSVSRLIGSGKRQKKKKEKNTDVKVGSVGLERE